MATPHDEFFRYAFSDPNRARDLIRNALPPALLDRLDLNSLVIEKKSFIDEALADRAADLLMQVRFRGAEPTAGDTPAKLEGPRASEPRYVGGEESADLYVYLLFEHKSYSDPDTLFQLLRYMVRIWEHHRRKFNVGAGSREREKGASRETDPYRLPPIIPVVLFHGETPWRGPSSFAETVGGNAELKPHILNFAPVIFDLTTRSDVEISGDRLTQLVLLLFKHLRRSAQSQAGAARVAEILSSAEPELTSTSGELTQRNRMELLRAALHYIQQVLTDEEFRSIISLVGARTVKQEAMSAAETYEKRGEKRGEQRGEKRGETRGRLQDKQQVLTRQLERKFGLTDEERRRIASESDPDKLDAALDALVFAENKGEVLAEIGLHE
jgi:predicted transposase YdaD